MTAFDVGHTMKRILLILSIICLSLQILSGKDFRIGKDDFNSDLYYFIDVGLLDICIAHERRTGHKIYWDARVSGQQLKITSKTAYILTYHDRALAELWHITLLFM